MGLLTKIALKIPEVRTLKQNFAMIEQFKIQVEQLQKQLAYEQAMNLERYVKSGQEYQRFLSAQNNPNSKSEDFKTHKNTWPEFDRLGAGVSDYRPTFEFGGPFINPNHKFYSECKMGGNGIECCIDVGIGGYLQRSDALKLYEMAYFTKGDILELGTHCGLSASIMAKALADSGKNWKIETDDIDASTTDIAKANIKSQPGASQVHFHVQDATALLEDFASQKRKFGFIFIDHWHGYQVTLDAAKRVDKLLMPGGFVLFHDFNDPSNFDVTHPYGVYQAVVDTLCIDRENFEFCGTYGCCALFRKIG